MYNTFSRTIKKLNTYLANETKYNVVASTPYMEFLQEYISLRNNFYCSDNLIENVNLIQGLFTHLQHSLFVKKFYGRKPIYSPLDNLEIKHNQYNTNPLIHTILSCKFYAANFIYNIRLLNLVHTSLIFTNNLTNITNQFYSFNL